MVFWRGLEKVGNKVVVLEKGLESLVCESIDAWHGAVIVKLLNANYDSKNRNAVYKMVGLDYKMNVVPCRGGEGCRCVVQKTIFDY